eukprot:CAMPEP_0174258290 /NCGR_PEP_ID=MMETSP0439-20130205/7306_1 /TAXON_ID=0 /ORGANISM="Stereomyxa ramosa, Strain Chinc5" /LENGTH=174 /DNA_ID=CAMNT_0015341739 /DNA_START=123 /DNA_END=647 /DNA_ORIENTATION=+
MKADKRLRVQHLPSTDSVGSDVSSDNSSSRRIHKRFHNTYLVCVDGSDYSLAAMKRVCEELYEPKDVIFALVVGRRIQYDLPSYDKLDAKQNARIEAKLASVKQYLSGLPDIKVNWLRVNGDPRKEILVAIKERRATLVVVGNKGRSDLKNAMLGSVSMHVLRKATCPVLVVRK